MSNVLEPQDVDGVGGLTKRTNDWTSQDKAWFYVPATRRVRRVNAATRSDPVAGLDIFADDLNCYGGKIEYYKWKLIGEGKILRRVLSPEAVPAEADGQPDPLRGGHSLLQGRLRDARVPRASPGSSSRT